MKTRRFLQLALATIFAVSLLGAARPAGAFVKVTGPSEDYFLELGVLLQPQLGVSHSMASDDTNFDAYLRRARILFSGQVSKWVSFFLETDQPNWGKGGNWSTDFFIQDAFVTFNFADWAKVSTGMLLVSPNRHFRQSAVSLSTLDYHTKPAKFPAGNVWRDMGIELRGLVLNKRIDYRFSITNGSPAAYEDIPRFTGRLGYNFMDAEEGFFFGGNYFGKKKLLSLGVGFDVQPINEDDTFFAISADLGWSLPFKGGNTLTGNFGFLYYGDDNGLLPIGVGAAAAAPTAGMGLLFDVGYAIGRFQPTLVMDLFIPKDADEFRQMDFLLGFGVAYWLQGHNANVKLQVALDKGVGSEFEDMAIVTTIQTQLFL